MKTIWSILKSTLKVIGVFILVICLAGLAFRLLASAPQPPGELVSVGDHRLHINVTGHRNDKPALIIESGAGAPSEYYYWLGEGLKDSLLVVRYDRAGLGYSDPANTPRDPETTARELHTLLKNAGVPPPYIMAGHSYGGHYARVFTDLYPDEVAGLVFLDAPHPDESKRLNMPPEPEFLNASYKVGAVLGDLGVLGLFDRMLGPILWAPGLPDEVTERYHDYTLSGNYLRGYLKEEAFYPALIEMSGEIDDFGSVPIRVFAGTKLNEKALRKLGLNPADIRTERKKMQVEVANLSDDGEAFFLDGGHITIFSLRENAEVICREVLVLAGGV